MFDIPFINLLFDFFGLRNKYLSKGNRSKSKIRSL